MSEYGDWWKLRRRWTDAWEKCSEAWRFRSRQKSNMIAVDDDEMHIPVAAKAVMKVTSLSGELDSEEDVIQLLNALELSEYVHKFQQQHVDFEIFKELDNEDLKIALQIDSLAPRRLILEAIGYINEMSDKDTTHIVPEHGRLLTHLDNTRHVIAWFQLSIWCIQYAVFSMNIPEVLSQEDLKPALGLFSIMSALCVLFYGMFRYLFVTWRVESIHRDYLPDHRLYLITTIFVVAFSGGSLIFLTLSPDNQTSMRLSSGEEQTQTSGLNLLLEFIFNALWI
uniref:SAM domain-containing protein n=1 Tax=Timspurckia oligopyrenoides TaxID=708627 RepID=A0A6T6NFL1_9RHOD|mmetsp:Transcript_8887/g.16010  ORF Transcript_8887/g.16010 Transcript_8887/m.16010 type:complete len:281 (+) Transcript_8887:44-886(+)